MADPNLLTASSARLDRAVQVLRQNAIRLVAFDMDLTAVAMHSHGSLQRSKLDDYLDRATPDFVQLVPRLHQEGFSLCIATHSDEAEFGGLIRPDTHILGAELARALLERYFERDVASSFFVVAYNPRARGEDGSKETNRIKRHHMREAKRHFGVESHEILFFDDTKQVVEDCIAHCGIHAVQVDARSGFQLGDLIEFEF